MEEKEDESRTPQLRDRITWRTHYEDPEGKPRREPVGSLNLLGLLTAVEEMVALVFMLGISLKGFP